MCISVIDSRYSTHFTKLATLSGLESEFEDFSFSLLYEINILCKGRLGACVMIFVMYNFISLQCQRRSEEDGD